MTDPAKPEAVDLSATTMHCWPGCRLLCEALHSMTSLGKANAFILRYYIAKRSLRHVQKRQVIGPKRARVSHVAAEEASGRKNAGVAGWQICDTRMLILSPSPVAVRVSSDNRDLVEQPVGLASRVRVKMLTAQWEGAGPAREIQV